MVAKAVELRATGRTQPKQQDPPKSRIDYSGLAFPKTGGKATGREKATVKALVFARDEGICRAWGVSPVCQTRAWDRHELIPVGLGGPVTTQNCITICRADHRACQNGIGGHSLTFTWPGKAKGRPPNADKPGQVRAIWRGLWNGIGKPQPKGTP